MSNPDYKLLQSQLKVLLAGESDPLANASNFVALLNTAMNDVNWLGVCGTAAEQRQTQRAEDQAGIENLCASYCALQSGNDLYI